VTSGEDPIERCPRKDDKAHMTGQDIRYVARVRVTGPARDGERRSARRSPSLPPEDRAVTKVQQLQASIRGGTYEVNSRAVAEAILKRLLPTDEGDK